jgi:peptidyl-prolyl cis-trans isomerase D
MISWIQRYFQHHFKTIFAVLLAVTIISFIFTIGASPGIGRGDRRVIERQYFNYNLALPEDQHRLMGDASLSAELQFGAFGADEEQIKQYALQRGASLYLADQWHIPPATPGEIKDAIMKLRMFSGQNGEFDAKAYDAFRKNLQANAGGAREADIARVIGDDVRAQKVNKLLAGPGYVQPREIKTQLEQADTTWTIATATVDYAAYNPEIKPTEAELNKFYTDNAFRYQISPRVVASYVEFPSTAFLPQVNVTEAEVRAFYDANPARFPKPPEVKPADAKPATPPPPANPAADYAAVRPQVEATLKLERAQHLAEKAASDLAVKVFESKTTNGPDLDALLTSQKLQQKQLTPFTREEGPAELGHSPSLAEAAFGLNKEHFVSDALPSPTGAVVLFWRDIQPARTPLFSEVRAKVVADYVKNEKDKRFIEVGKAVKAQIEARLKAGDSFEKAVASAASASGLKIEAKTVAPFTIRNRPQDVDYTVLSALEHLNKGEVSNMITPQSGDKGIFVFAQDKKLPDLSESNPRYTEMRTQLEAYASTFTGRAYVSELVDRELERTKPKPE